MDHQGQKLTLTWGGAASLKTAERQTHQHLAAPTHESDEDTMSSADGLDTSLVDRRLMEYPLMGTLAEVSTVQRVQHGSAEKAAAAVDVAELDAAVAKLTKEGQLRFLCSGKQLLSILQTAKADFYGLGEWACPNTVLLESAARAAMPAADAAGVWYTDCKAPAELLKHLPSFYKGLGLHPDF